MNVKIEILLNDINKEIDGVIASTMDKLSAAALSRDVSVTSELARRAEEFRSIKGQLTALGGRLRHLVNGTPLPVEPSPINNAIRELVITVSEGSIRQNLMTLTEHVKRGTIRVGERLRIKTHPSGDCFETELLSSGNKLRERGHIAKFYRDAGVHAGDQVVLFEVTPGQWELRKIERIRRQY